MTGPSNQDIEQCYFEQFRRDYELPAGDWHYSDRPDVVIEGAHKIGIEITNLYLEGGDKPESEQVQGRRRIQVLRRAQEMFIAAGGPKTELSIGFNPSFPILETETLANALASLAQQMIGQPTQQVARMRYKHVPQLSFIYHNGREYPDATWRLVQSFNVPLLCIDRLQAVVSDKSAKVSKYQPCDCYWLLVVVDFMDPAQDQHLTWPPGNVLRGSAYGKVFLYKPQFREVIEVPQ
jgi:hypothetical protein